MSTVEIYDRSFCGILELTGKDRVRFLHNQTTNQINLLNSGQGCDVVFVNSTGRTLELATAYVTEESILIVVSPNRRQFLLDWMDRYIFPMDKVTVSDLSPELAIFTLLGSESRDFLEQFGISSNILDQSEASHELVALAGIQVRIAVGTDLGLSGYTLILPIAQAAKLWKELTEKGAIPMSDRQWEELRISQGRPMSEQELTEDYNALEAGLWRAISFDKGCYIGQETIARLNTYKGVKQRLWGLKLNQSVEPLTPISLDDEKIGVLTSCLETDEGAIGLGYIRTKAGGAGMTVKIGEAIAQVIAVPFLSHDYYDPSSETK
ncbi:folate-binding protein YgfZ [Chroococcus sp. FPU101]|uniref:CAF17-like 4Fe-4S cluster assembly/insertion protein YgfZ n=1 Tax=Chroococcus sp. FPU101 TaxID=1974212 RepID=UPI001A902358|nr:folate-binding protein YgfZ [Chroococcus sp. FPU101]GFE69431.1 folate-binding protein YgfZ [Chroococcus sp. FPU101]